MPYRTVPGTRHAAAPSTHLSFDTVCRAATVSVEANMAPSDKALDSCCRLSEPLTKGSMKYAPPAMIAAIDIVPSTPNVTSVKNWWKKSCFLTLNPARTHAKMHA